MVLQRLLYGVYICFIYYACLPTNDPENAIVCSAGWLADCLLPMLLLLLCPSAGQESALGGLSSSSCAYTIESRERESLTAKCKAIGNPMPAIHKQRMNQGQQQKRRGARSLVLLRKGEPCLAVLFLSILGALRWGLLYSFTRPISLCASDTYRGNQPAAVDVPKGIPCNATTVQCIRMNSPSSSLRLTVP